MKIQVVNLNSRYFSSEGNMDGVGTNGSFEKIPCHSAPCNNIFLDEWNVVQHTWPTWTWLGQEMQRRAVRDHCTSWGYCRHTLTVGAASTAKCFLRKPNKVTAYKQLSHQSSWRRITVLPYKRPQKRDSYFSYSASTLTQRPSNFRPCNHQREPLESPMRSS